MSTQAFHRIRSGKGEKDRTTVLPERIKGRLKSYLQRIKKMHDQDSAKGCGAKTLPDAFGKKYPIDDVLIFRDFNFRHEDGLFLLDLTVPVATRITVPLLPLNDDEAIILGLGRHMGETIRTVSVNGKEGLLYSGYKLIKKECD